MPCFTENIIRLQPICNVVIISPPIDNKIDNEIQIDIDLFQKHTYKALLDTGATKSCISDKIVEKLEISPFQMEKVANTLQVTKVPIYKVCLFIPFSKILQKNDGSLHNDVKLNSFMNIEVAEIKEHQENTFSAIIGMDIISQGNLNISANSYNFCL